MDNESLQTLKCLMNEVLDDKFSSFKTELIGTMDEKLEHLEGRMDQKLESLESRMDQKLDGLENRMDQKLESLENRMDQKLESLENRMIDTRDAKIRDSENLLLEEMERTRTILEDKIDKIQQNVDNLNQYYQLAKLENDNILLVIESVQNLTKRVEVLEGKSA